MNRNSFRVGVAVLAMTAALTAAPAAEAVPASQFSEPINLTYPDDYLTDLCGFPVFFSLVGTPETTLL
jgi:hypothetical protein